MPLIGSWTLEPKLVVIFGEREMMKLLECGNFLEKVLLLCSRKFKFASVPVCSLCFLHTVEDVSVFLLQLPTAMLPCHDELPIPTHDTIIQNKLFQELLLAVAFYHSNKWQIDCYL